MITYLLLSGCLSGRCCSFCLRLSSWHIHCLIPILISCIRSIITSLRLYNTIFKRSSLKRQCFCLYFDFIFICLRFNAWTRSCTLTPIEKGDVLLSTVGSYGHPAIVTEDRPFAFQRHIAHLKSNRELLTSEFLHAAILSSVVQEQIELLVLGVAQKTLNLSAIKQIQIPVPTIDEQKLFVTFVEQSDKSKFFQSYYRFAPCALIEAFSSRCFSHFSYRYKVNPRVQFLLLSIP